MINYKETPTDGDGEVKNHLVTQRNELVEAYHVQPLSTNEQKLILTLISKIEPQDNDLETYSIRVADFADMIGVTGQSVYSEIKKISKSLVGKTLEIPIGEKDWLITAWVSSVRYYNDEGMIEVAFDAKLKPYLLQLKNQFTSYRLTNILSLTSGYSIRLYELLKKWQHQKKWVCDLQELKNLLGIQKIKSYNLYGSFKQRILLPAINELNQKTDLSIEWVEIKQGRKVIKLHFLIKNSQSVKVSSIETEKDSLKELRIALNERLKPIGVNLTVNTFKQVHDQAKAIWNDTSFQQLSYLTDYIVKDKSIHNPLGFLRYQLKEAENEKVQNKHLVDFKNLHFNIPEKEALPDWFKKTIVKKEKSDLEKEEMEKKKARLKEELKKMEERI